MAQSPEPKFPLMMVYSLCKARATPPQLQLQRPTKELRPWDVPQLRSYMYTCQLYIHA